MAERISIVTVSHNRPIALQRFLGSLIPARGFSNTEVLILLNGKEQGEEHQLQSFCAQYPNIRIIRSPHSSRGATRNLLLKEATGDVVYFLDDDVCIKEDTLSVLQEALLRHPEHAIFGGPNLTFPDADVFSRAQGLVLGNFFGTLWMNCRYRQCRRQHETDERGLILCNLAIRKSVFTDTNIYFDPSLICAEENLLLRHLHACGYRAMHVPAMVVYHERRKNFSGFIRQIFAYGQGRCQAITAFPDVWYNLPYFLPAVFILYVCSLAIPHPGVYYMPLWIYCVTTLFCAVLLAARAKDAALFPLIAFLFPLLHSAYGAGFVTQLLFPHRSGNVYPLAVTVIIPTFNRRASLRRVLEALGRQTYPRQFFEVIVVDDGSDDGTVDYVRDQDDAIPLTLLQTSLNEGPAGARNLGLEQARGEIVAFLDDDCCPEPDWLEQMVATFCRQPHTAAVGGSVLNPADMPLAWAAYILEFSSWLPTRNKGWINNLCGCNVAYRRSRLAKLRFPTGFKGMGFEDSILNFKLRQAGGELFFQPKMRVWHGKWEESFSKQCFLEEQRRYARGFLNGGFRAFGRWIDPFLIFPNLNKFCLRLFFVAGRCLRSYRLTRKFLENFHLILRGETERNRIITAEFTAANAKRNYVKAPDEAAL